MPHIITCCKDCKDRFIGCHDKCEKYLTLKAKHEKLKEINSQHRKSVNEAKAIHDQRFSKKK